MAILVIDASIVLAVLLPDETDPRADLAVEAAARRGAFAPSHWPLEIANGLLVAERRRRITDSMRRKSLADVSQLSVEIDTQTNNAAWGEASDLAAKHKLSVYDAVYLELAKRLGLPLATLDNDLKTAALSESVAIFGEV